MSFSEQVKEELNSIQIKGNCCKRAYLFGAMLSGEEREGHIRLRLSDASTADKVKFLLNSIYKCSPEVKSIKRGCYESTELCFDVKKLSDFLAFADSYEEGEGAEGCFSCENCLPAFIRGAFCASGSISDPHKSYTLEMRMPNRGRAELLRNVMGKRGLTVPRLTERRNAIGLFYRNESDIEALIAVCGANSVLFGFYDAAVEKDYRNSENRATNCDARNISRSVVAAAAHVSAIESLIATGAIEDMPCELKITARLRLENPAVTLGELASMHTPPLSKSGLNHRLSKIVEQAKKRRLI